MQGFQLRIKNVQLRIKIMKENIIRKKSFEFEIRVKSAFKYLQTDKKELKLSKQSLRLGTGIDANVDEAKGGQSRKDFIPKFQLHIKNREKQSFGQNY